MVVWFIFSLILQIWYVNLRISWSISDSSLEFEITRVDRIVGWHKKKKTTCLCFRLFLKHELKRKKMIPWRICIVFETHYNYSEKICLFCWGKIVYIYVFDVTLKPLVIHTFTYMRHLYMNCRFKVDFSFVSYSIWSSLPRQPRYWLESSHVVQIFFLCLRSTGENCPHCICKKEEMRSSCAYCSSRVRIIWFFHKIQKMFTNFEQQFITYFFWIKFYFSCVCWQNTLRNAYNADPD